MLPAIEPVTMMFPPNFRGEWPTLWFVTNSHIRSYDESVAADGLERESLSTRGQRDHQ
jgi:hypothetical protein